MFKTLRLWQNVLVGMVLTVVIVLLPLIWTNLHLLEQTLVAQEQQQLRGYAHAARVAIAAETRLAEALSTLVAEIPAVQDAFARGDRAWLVEQLLPAYATLHDRYGAVQFQFHTPPAISFLRLHLLTKHGDDLSAFRHSVVDTNTKKEPQRGLEVGVADLGARGMVPVFQRGRHLGSVEFGLSFGPEFLTAFKEQYGVEIALHVWRHDDLELFGSTGDGATRLTAAARRAALDGTPQWARVEHAGQSLAVYAEAVHDYSGQPLGVLTLAMDRAPVLAARARAVRQAGLAMGLVVLLGGAFALLTARGLARRTARLARGMEAVAAGDLTVAITLDGRDELAQLAQVAERMRGELRSLAREIEQRAAAAREDARTLATAADARSGAAAEVSAAVVEITATVEELTASAAQIADYARNVATIARRNEDDSHAGTATMDALTQHLETLRAENSAASNAIGELRARSRDITKIMEIIKKVADQTRLIAFNAALEAATAEGLGGRFGIVAGEIRRLADSVRASAEEIAEQIGGVLTAIEQLTAAVERVATTTEHSLSAATATARRWQGATRTAGELGTVARQIEHATQQQQIASEQVTAALRDIVAASGHAAESARHVAVVAGAMTAAAERLQQDVGRLRA